MHHVYSIIFMYHIDCFCWGCHRHASGLGHLRQTSPPLPWRLICWWYHEFSGIFHEFSDRPWCLPCNGSLVFVKLSLSATQRSRSLFRIGVVDPPTGGSCWRSSFWCWLPGRCLDVMWHMWFLSSCVVFLRFYSKRRNVSVSVSIISDPFLGMTLILGLKVGTQKFCPSIFESVTLAVCVQRTKTRRPKRFEVGKRMQNTGKGAVWLCDNHWYIDIGHAIHRSGRDVDKLGRRCLSRGRFAWSPPSLISRTPEDLAKWISPQLRECLHFLHNFLY